MLPPSREVATPGTDHTDTWAPVAIAMRPLPHATAAVTALRRWGRHTYSFTVKDAAAGLVLPLVTASAAACALVWATRTQRPATEPASTHGCDPSTPPAPAPPPAPPPALGLLPGTTNGVQHTGVAPTGARPNCWNLSLAGPRCCGNRMGLPLAAAAAALSCTMRRFLDARCGCACWVVGVDVLRVGTTIGGTVDATNALCPAWGCKLELEPPPGDKPWP